MFPASIKITNGRRHSPREWSEMAIEHIMSIDRTSVPAPIVQQAEAFKEEIRKMIEHFLGMAAEEARSYAATNAEQAGRPDIAEAIRQAP